MRFEKLTTKFQQALADAQSLALANDNGAIEPVHLLSTMLDQEDGGAASLLSRAGVAVPKLKQAVKKAIDRLPKGINYAANIGHSALRTWAMGERAWEGQASEDELGTMEHELRDALMAGAVVDALMRGRVTRSSHALASV